MFFVPNKISVIDSKLGVAAILVVSVFLVGPTVICPAHELNEAENGLQDSDEDGVPDDFDNCIFVFNPDQRDTNGDCFGNICDADLNNDGIVNREAIGVVNAIDLGLLRLYFFGDFPDADFNGDGYINAVDLAIFKGLFFSPPGPGNCPAVE